MLKGYVLNQEKLQKQKFQELEQTIQLIKQGLQNKDLSTQEAKGFVEIISDYAKSWAMLQGYDDQSLQELSASTEEKFVLGYDEAKEAIVELKTTLMKKGEATKLFGQEKAGEFKGNLLNIYQSFGGLIFYLRLKQKRRIFFTISSKGIRSTMVISVLGRTCLFSFYIKTLMLYKSNGEPKINDNALASIALLVAQSDPSQKEIIIKLVMNMLYDGDV